MNNYETDLLLQIWNRFWFSLDLEPEILNTPTGVTEFQWISMVYNELRNRNIWPTVEQRRWQEKYMQKLKDNQKRVELLEQQRLGFG